MAPGILLCLLWLLNPATGATLDCLRKNKECRDKIVTSFSGIPWAKGCSVLCQDNPACRAFTYYSQDNFPFSETCLLFEGCENRNPCVNCITGSSQNECSCSEQFHGAVNANNVVEIKSSTYGNSLEVECKVRCRENEKCNYYTFYDYNPDRNNYKKCVLLSHLSDLVPCNNCRTGPANCKLYLELNSTTTTPAATTTGATNTESFALAYSPAIFMNIILTLLVVMWQNIRRNKGVTVLSLKIHIFV